MHASPKADISIVFSNHRPETLPFSAVLMREYPVVVLEEPPHPEFGMMLNGEYPINDYVSLLDTEYFEFSLQSCRLFRELHVEGTRFIQVEPFLERLLFIHEMFAEGKSPEDIPKDSSLMDVYMAEKIATGALIDYYESAARTSFDAIMASLKRFARSDADRFRLRDRMRAQALSDLTQDLLSAYIEAGTMHVWLRHEMRRRCSRRDLSSHHLMASEVNAITGRSMLMGPGDALTLIYIFAPHARGRRCDRLAARSLIFNKIVGKVEIADPDGTYPHLREEYRAGNMVNQLDIDDCAILFPAIRTAGTQEANARVAAYLKKQKR